ncbi:MAG: ATP-binding cassette domain-containing protein [Candidatus Eisenbacteria bacterium]
MRKAYPGGFELGPLDLHVGHGRTVALLGPSGCGKSTILRLLTGLARPDEGSLTVRGIEVRPERLRDSVLPHVGYVVQEGGLFPHLTAAQNVSLVPRDRGWSADRIARRVSELARLVHLDSGLLARFPADLSGGQRQRVALMRALVHEPDVLLLDEPLGALDPMIRARLQDDLGALFRTLRKTVLLVTHDLAEAATLADDIVLLRAGQIVQRGAWRDLVERPADDFVREFVAAQSRGAPA